MDHLQDQLDRITEKTRQLVQADRLAISERATAELFSTGIEDRILPVGAQAPPFELADISGRLIRSEDLLALGPLVINFFRGRWCPYCVTELETWRDLYPELRQAGVLLVAISPQNVRQNSFTADSLRRNAPHSSTFPILSDPEAALAEKFGIAYTVPEPERRYFQSILVNIPFANSGKSYANAPDSAWNLPLPATVIVDEDGTVAYSEAHADFRVRPEPADILAALSALKS